MEYPILLVLIIFAATTIFYLTLYWKTSPKCSRSYVMNHEDIDTSEEATKLREALVGDYVRLKVLLEELKKIRRRAELLLDEGGSSEGEGGGDKRSTEGG